MVLHLAESKQRWFAHNASVAAALPPYAPRPGGVCYDVAGLGALAEDEARRRCTYRCTALHIVSRCYASLRFVTIRSDSLHAVTRRYTP